MYDIYKIENKVTKMCYIGRTADYKRRIVNHKSKLRLGKHINKNLQEAYKENPKCFTYSKIETVSTLEESFIREQYYVDLYKEKNLAYNIMGGGHKGLPRESHPNLGKSMPKGVREQIRLSRTGQSLGENNHFYGKKHTDETKARISASRKGKTTGGKNPYAKSVFVNGVIYGSVKEGRTASGLTRHSFSKRLLDPENEDYSYVDEGI